jgi:hypothetical protein
MTITGARIFSLSLISCGFFLRFANKYPQKNMLYTYRLTIGITIQASSHNTKTRLTIRKLTQ